MKLKWLVSCVCVFAGWSAGCGPSVAGHGPVEPFAGKQKAKAQPASGESGQPLPERKKGERAAQLDEQCSSWTRKGILDVATLYCEGAFRLVPSEARFEQLTELYDETHAWLAHRDLLLALVKKLSSWTSDRNLQAELDRLDLRCRPTPLEGLVEMQTLIQARHPSELEALRAAAEIAPDPTVHARLGELLLAEGKTVEAERHFSMARVRMREEGARLELRAPDHPPRIAYDGQSLVTFEEGEARLWEGPPEAMNVRWTAQIPEKSWQDGMHGVWKFMFFPEQHELALYAGAALNLDTGAMFMRYPTSTLLHSVDAGALQENLLRFEQTLDSSVRFPGRELSARERELRFLHHGDRFDSLTDAPARSYPLTPWSEIRAGFDRGCSLTAVGALCVRYDGLAVRVVPSEPKSPFGLDHEDEPLAQLPKPGQDYGAQFSQDGGRVLVVDTRLIRVFDVSTGRKLLELDEGTHVPDYIDLSPDGRRLVLGSYIGKTPRPLRVFDVQTGREVRRLAQIEAGFAQFSPDGKMLYATGSTESSLIRLSDGHTTALRRGTGIQFSASGSTFLERFRGRGTLRSTGTGEMLATYTSRGGLLATLDKGKALVALGACDGTVRLLDVGAGTLTSFSPLASTRRVCIEQLALAADDSLLIAGEQGKLRAWAVGTGSLLWDRPFHLWSSHTIALSGDAKRLAVGEADGAVHVLDARTGKVLASPVTLGAPVTAVAWSPDGQMLAVGGKDGTLRVVEPNQGKVRVETNERTIINQIAFTHNDFVDYAGGDASRWDLETNRTVELTGYGDLAVCTSSDGRYVVGGGDVGGSRVVFETKVAAEEVQGSPPSRLVRPESSQGRHLAGLDWGGSCAVVGDEPIVLFISEHGRLGMAALEFPAGYTPEERERLPQLGVLSLGERGGWAFVSAGGAAEGNQPELLGTWVSGFDPRFSSRLAWGARLTPGLLRETLAGAAPKSPWAHALEETQ